MAKKNRTTDKWDKNIARLNELERVIRSHTARLAKLKEIRAPQFVIECAEHCLADVQKEYLELNERMERAARRLLAAIFGK